MSLLEHHRKMLAFEGEANRRVIASLRTVPADRCAALEMTKARGIFAHNQMARRMWLSRLGVVARPDWVMFPDWPLGRIETEMTELDRLWGSYLETLHQNDLSRAVHYTSTEGVEYISTISEILTHVHNHSTYHRGQIAALVTISGGDRAPTDFIGITRRTR
jgi:uncharacterized damage-inducible protein DinB